MMNEPSPPNARTDQVSSLLASAPFGIVAIAPDGSVLAANEAAGALMGSALAAGAFLADFLADSGDSLLLDDLVRNARGGERVQRSFRITADGVLRLIDMSCWCEPNGDPDVVFAMLADPPEADLVSQLANLIANSPTGMARLDTTGSLITVNSRWSDITGQPTEAALGTGWLGQIDEDARTDFEAALLASLHDQSGIRGRLRLNTDVGATRWIDISTTPLDRPAGALLSFEDTTEGLDAARRADELSRVLEATKDLVGILSPDGVDLVWVNETLAEFLASDAMASAFVQHLDKYSHAQFIASALPAVHDDGSWRGELNLVRRDGVRIPVSAMFVAHHDNDGECEAISVVARDLSDLRDAQERVAASETRLAALVEHASDLTVLVNCEGIIEYASPAVERVLAHAPGSLDGVDVLELVHPDDLPVAYEASGSVLASAGASRTMQVRVAHGDGSYRHLEVIANNLLTTPAVAGIVLNASDITDRVEAAQQLEVRTYHDDLTGLPNRTLLIDLLRDTLRRARERRLLVGLLFLDLDRFKVVNESLGHAAGDELLSEVAERINAVIRPGDTVARLGGDEFAVVIGDMLRPNDAVVAARRIRKALTQPIEIGTDSTVITTSIGITIAEGNEEPEDLLRDADTALHQAKDKGRDVAVLFDDHLRDQAVRRLEVENMLRRAIEADALVVHYQPVLSTTTGQLSGAEALVRIRNDDGSLTMPGHFIDVAEDSGLISVLGHQVLVKAIRQAAAWTHLQIPGQAPLSIAVNVSARQLTDPNYPRELERELATAGLAPSQLSLELTESALIDGNPATETSLHYLRELGVRIGLDDFGTGFSSLAHLRRFPISFLKVDRSFTDGLGTDENDSAIVRGTIALAHGLNLSVVAEGVETQQQLDLLAGLDCDFVQGYLFSKPVDPTEFESFLGMRWGSIAG